MTLTGKQKRYLRGLGNKLTPTAIIGKGGLSESAVTNLAILLDRHELIKVRLDQSQQGAARRLAADQMAEATSAACVAVVGRSVLLYRANEHLPGDQRIRLDT